MTDVVAEQVLEDNYGQNVVLGNARAGATGLVTVHQRMIRELERLGLLDRALEFLPDDEEFRTRRTAGEGLTSPELAVLLAYSKIWLTEVLNESGIADEPYFARALTGYFPPALAQRFGDALQGHPLRPQIISTVTCNRLINLAGITFVFRAMEETGRQRRRGGPRRVGRGRDLRHPRHVEPDQRRGQRHPDDGAGRACTWRPGACSTAPPGGSCRPVAARSTSRARSTASRASSSSTRTACRRPCAARSWSASSGSRSGSSPPARRPTSPRSAASALDVFALLDITDICVRTGESVDTVVPLYFTVSERYDIDRTLVRITQLPRNDRWSSLARQALRSDLYAVVAGLTSRVLRSTEASMPPLDRLAEWERMHQEGVGPGPLDARGHRRGRGARPRDAVGGPARDAQPRRPGHDLVGADDGATPARVGRTGARLGAHAG